MNRVLRTSTVSSPLHQVPDLKIRGNQVVSMRLTPQSLVTALEIQKQDEERERQKGRAKARARVTAKVKVKARAVRKVTAKAARGDLCKGPARRAWPREQHKKLFK